jgi:hypothetical protein
MICHFLTNGKLAATGILVVVVVVVGTYLGKVL